MKTVVLILIMLLAETSFGALFLVCGKGALRTGMGFRKIEIQIYSHNGTFQGPAGNNWSYKLRNQDRWANNNTSAAITTGNDELLLSLPEADDLSSVEYVISNITESRATMDKYTYGTRRSMLPLDTFVCKISDDSIDPSAY
jgi:hypothetical protein